jgi:hypothetical protein
VVRAYALRSRSNATRMLVDLTVSQVRCEDTTRTLLSAVHVIAPNLAQQILYGPHALRMQQAALDCGLIKTLINSKYP